MNTHTMTISLSALLIAGAAVPAQAQDPPAAARPRAEVLAELRLARGSGELALLHSEMPLFEAAAPRRLAKESALPSPEQMLSQAPSAAGGRQAMVPPSAKAPPRGHGVEAMPAP